MLGRMFSLRTVLVHWFFFAIKCVTGDGFAIIGGRKVGGRVVVGSAPSCWLHKVNILQVLYARNKEF